MEVQGSRITGEFERDAVFGLDIESAGGDSTDTRHLHLLGRQWDVVLMGMFDHGLANFLFRAGDGSGLQSFFLEGILKLVVGEARRCHLDARHNHRPKHAEAQDQFQCRHQIRSPIPSAGSTGLLVAEAHVLAFGQPANQRTSPSKCSLIAEILMSSRARVERRTTSTKSSVTFFPTLILKGIPTRSASLNLTPGRSSRSSSKTSSPA